MAEHLWSVLCRKGLVDTYTNTVSLLDVMEGIEIRPLGETLTEHGLMPIELALVSLWRRTDPNRGEKFEVQLRVLAPDDAQLTEMTIAGDLESNPRLRTFGRLEAFPFRGPGTYKFVVRQRATGNAAWEHAAMVPMEVQIGKTLPVAQRPKRNRVKTLRKLRAALKTPRKSTGGGG